MTADVVRASLLAAGFDPEEVPGRVRLHDAVVRTFSEVVQAQPDHAWWVPGRLEVFGTHTDYAGGRSLVAAVPRGFMIGASRRADHVVRVVDASRKDNVLVDARETRFVFGGWRHYVEVVVERLARNFPDAALGADIVFASDLPRASGMSSSSALVVGVATALVRIAGLRDRPEWQANIRGPLQEAAYYSCIENGLGFGTLTGDAGVGTHGGSEDHAAMLSSTPGALTAFAFVPMRRLDVVRVPDEWRFVICSSGVTAEKTGSARESYNRLADGVRVLLESWNEVEPPAASLGAALESGPAALQRLQALLARSPAIAWTPAALGKRLEHFVRENRRVTAALHALRGADAAAVGELAASSQTDAERLLENQIDATVILTRTAYQAGAFAARSFGAGFGGSVWALVERRTAASFADRWLALYGSRCSSASTAVVFVTNPAPPVVEL